MSGFRGSSSGRRKRDEERGVFDSLEGWCGLGGFEDDGDVVDAHLQRAQAVGHLDGLEGLWLARGWSLRQRHERRERDRALLAAWDSIRLVLALEVSRDGNSDPAIERARQTPDACRELSSCRARSRSAPASRRSPTRGLRVLVGVVVVVGVVVAHMKAARERAARAFLAARVFFKWRNKLNGTSRRARAELPPASNEASSGGVSPRRRRETVSNRVSGTYTAVCVSPEDHCRTKSPRHTCLSDTYVNW